MYHLLRVSQRTRHFNHYMRACSCNLLILSLALLLLSIQVKGLYLYSHSKKYFEKNSLFYWELYKNANLLNTLSFWLALKQILAIWPSNLNLLSIFKPKTLTWSLSQILSPPNSDQICSKLSQKWANDIYQCLVS